MSKYIELAVELNDFMYDIKAMFGNYISKNPYITKERTDKLIEKYQGRLLEWEKETNPSYWREIKNE